MKDIIRRAAALCICTALTASLAACGSSDSSSSAGSTAESTAESGAADTAQSAESTAGDTSSTESKAYERNPLPVQPVTETMGSFDISDVQNESDVPADFKVEFEAENGTLNGKSAVLSKSSMGDFSGEGYIIIAQDADTSAEFEVELETAGHYDISVIAARAAEDAVGQVLMDGKELRTISVSSKEFEENGIKNIELPAGKHTFAFKSTKSNLFIDKVAFAAPMQVDLSLYDVKKELSNPNAGDETKRLYNFLRDCYGRYTISGQYSGDNMGSSSAEFYVIEQTTGKKPAMLGLDLIELSPSRLAHGSSGGNMVPQQAVDWWNNSNGIVTLCWHWNAPEPYLETKNDGAWWQGFYSEYTNFSLAKALSKEDEEGYNYLIRDIDAIADTLAYLDDQHVPILWRPLHEGGGDPKWHNPWFWWGSSGADAFIELWKLMYDRLTNVHHINNLIWVWNGQDPDYYPGDEYVDIIGYDIYPDKGDTSSQKPIFDLMKSVTEEKKIIALTENGVIPDPAATFADGSRWCWFATWNGEFIFDGGEMKISDYTGEEKVKEFFNSERVLTLDELPDLKSYPLDTEKFLAENK